MDFRELLNRKNILILSAVVAAALGLAAYFGLRRPPRVAVERYLPASALAYVEVNDLPNLVEGLTDTNAWRELAPALGLSSQLGQIGFVADLMGRTGLGPDEVVIAGRAQYALALTSLEAETGSSPEGPYVHFRPRFALVIQTHASPDAAARIVRERASILAQRVYGESAAAQSEDYLGTQLLIFTGPQPERQLVAASSGSVVVLANHASAIRACLDAIAGRTATLAEDATLAERRSAMGQDAAVFAFLTEAGIQKLFEFAPAIIASRFTTDPDRVSTIANLFGHFSKQAAAGLLYSLEFASDGVVERYLTVLRPAVAEGLAEPLKAGPVTVPGSLSLIPRGVQDFTLLNVERAGDLPERLLKQLSPRVDVVAALALREFVISLRKQLGLEAADDISGAVGGEAALIRFNESEPSVLLVRTTDKDQLAPKVVRYLAEDGSKLSTEQYDGVEIAVSSNEDRRAAAFIGEFLTLGTRDQIVSIITARAAGNTHENDERLKRALDGRPEKASIISYRPGVEDAGEMMLAISKLTRVSDGSRELLAQDSVRAALARVPPSVSFTEFRDYGLYTETRSAVGSLSFISSLIGDDEQ